MRNFRRLRGHSPISETTTAPLVGLGFVAGVSIAKANPIESTAVEGNFVPEQSYHLVKLHSQLCKSYPDCNWRS